MSLKPTTTKAAALSAMAAAALLAGCATPPPRAQAWTPPPPGSTWEIAQRNTGSFGPDARMEVRRSDGTWNGRPAIAFVNSTGGTILAQPTDGRWLALVGRDGKPAVSYDPPIGWQYPLEVGKTWKQHHRMSNHVTGRSVEFDMACKVEAYEKVTVPAGSFDTFRIACQNSIGSAETYWTSAELGLFVKTRLVRPAGSMFGPGTQEAELQKVDLKR